MFEEDLTTQSNTAQPLISVITAVLNGEEYIEQTIQSIVNQSYKNVEYIVINDGSTDNTENILRKYDDQLAYWTSQPNSGLYSSWNKGLAQAKGDWICFLGADDYLWSLDVLEKVVPYLNQALPAIRVVYGKNHFITREQEGSIIMTHGQPWSEVKKRFLQEMCLPHPGMFHHRSLFEEHGQFDPTFRICGDYDFLLRELKHKDAQHIDILVAGTRIGGMSGKLDSMIASHREIRKARRNNGFPIDSTDIIDYITVYGYVLLRSVVGENITGQLADVYRKMRGKEALWKKEK